VTHSLRVRFNKIDWIEFGTSCDWIGFGQQKLTHIQLCISL